MEELAREEVALVRRAPERQARERREVRQRRDRDHEEDDEGEAEKLARAGTQSHTLDPPAETCGFGAHGGRLYRFSLLWSVFRLMPRISRRAGLVVARVGERTEDEPALGLVHGRADAQAHVVGPLLGGRLHRHGGGGRRRGQVGQPDEVPRAHDDGPLQHVAKLAHVPRPRVAAKHGEGRLVDAPDGSTVSLVELLEKDSDELSQVLGTLAQRRQREREHAIR